eukprot:1492823-Prymnesium_polylepis.1
MPRTVRPTVTATVAMAPPVTAIVATAPPVPVASTRGGRWQLRLAPPPRGDFQREGVPRGRRVAVQGGPRRGARLLRVGAALVQRCCVQVH